MVGIKDYKETQATSFGGELPKLEAGGYVIKIMAVEVEDTQRGARIALQFDIAEGEHKGFFKKLYDATPNDWDNKKWKGSYRIKIPKDEGDEARYRKAVGFFKSQIEAFEKSNPNFKLDASKDWDEQKLKGKLVGALFNEKEYDFNGRHGFFTQCKRFVPAADIREGNFTIPKPDMLASGDSFSLSGDDIAELDRNALAAQQAAGVDPTIPIHGQKTAKTTDIDLSDFEDILSDDGVPF